MRISTSALARSAARSRIDDRERPAPVVCASPALADIPDPDEYAAYSLSPIGGTYAFYTGFNDPRMTALVKRAQTTFLPVARRTLYAEIQRRADAGGPQLPLSYSPPVSGVARTGHGFRVYPLGNYHLETVRY